MIITEKKILILRTPFYFPFCSRKTGEQVSGLDYKGEKLLPCTINPIIILGFSRLNKGIQVINHVNGH